METLQCPECGKVIVFPTGHKCMHCGFDYVADHHKETVRVAPKVGEVLRVSYKTLHIIGQIVEVNEESGFATIETSPFVPKNYSRQDFDFRDLNNTWEIVT